MWTAEREWCADEYPMWSLPEAVGGMLALHMSWLVAGTAFFTAEVEMDEISDDFAAVLELERAAGHALSLMVSTLALQCLYHVANKRRYIFLPLTS